MNAPSQVEKKILRSISEMKLTDDQLIALWRVAGTIDQWKMTHDEIRVRWELLLGPRYVTGPVEHRPPDLPSSQTYEDVLRVLREHMEQGVSVGQKPWAVAFTSRKPTLLRLATLRVFSDAVDASLLTDTEVLSVIEKATNVAPARIVMGLDVQRDGVEAGVYAIADA